MYKKILVGYDDSPSSKAALAEAGCLAKRQGASLIVVNAVYSDEEEFGVPAARPEERMKLGENFCRVAGGLVTDACGIKAEELVCEGEPPQVILNAAREKKADLIALGTRGRKGLKRLIMGSVTARVVVEAPCEVLVVKKGNGPNPGVYGKILVPYDGSGASEKALARACEFSKGGSKVRVLYVIPRYQEMVEFIETDAIRRRLREEAEKIIARAAGEASRAAAAVETAIREGNPGDEILKMAADLGAELIAMGTSGWRGVNKALIGSTAERVISQSACPVLVINRTA